jgi:hypothetical protein
MSVPVLAPKKDLELVSLVFVRRRRFELARTEFLVSLATAAARIKRKASSLLWPIVALFPSKLDDRGNN